MWKMEFYWFFEMLRLPDAEQQQNNFLCVFHSLLLWRCFLLQISFLSYRVVCKIKAFYSVREKDLFEVTFVCLKDVSQMLVVPRALELSLLERRLLPLCHDRLSDSMVLHRPDSLLLEVFLDLRVVDGIDRGWPPQLLELLVDGEVRASVVVEENFLLINRAGDEHDVGRAVLQDSIAVRQRLLNVVEQNTAEALQIVLLQ